MLMALTFAHSYCWRKLIPQSWPTQVLKLGFTGSMIVGFFVGWSVISSQLLPANLFGSAPPIHKVWSSGAFSGDPCGHVPHSLQLQLWPLPDWTMGLTHVLQCSGLMTSMSLCTKECLWLCVYKHLHSTNECLTNADTTCIKSSNHLYTNDQFM